jgi:hypothetical protein
MLIGDSHADAMRESFVRVAASQNVSVAFAVPNDPLINPKYNSQWMVRNARAYGIRRIFMHFAPGNLSPELIERARFAAARQGILTFLVMPVPISSSSIPRSLFAAHNAGVGAPTIARADYLKRNSAIIAYAAKPHADLAVIPTLGTLCPADCPLASDDWRPYYWDSGHQTLLGARRLEPLLAKALAHAVANTKS